MTSDPNRAMDVYLGTAPPRNMYELGLAQQGKDSRKAWRDLYAPRSHPVKGMLDGLPGPKTKGEDEGSGGVILFIILLLCL